MRISTRLLRFSSSSSRLIVPRNRSFAIVMERARVLVASRNTPGENSDLKRLASVDKAFAGRIVAVPSEEHNRLVLSPTGSLLDDVDDVRKVGAAAAAGAMTAFSMGASHISVEVDEAIPKTQHPIDGAAFSHAPLVAELFVRQAASTTLQARTPSMLKYVQVHDIPGHSPPAGIAEAIEAGRALARAIGSGDPEMMAPPALAEHVRKVCGAEKTIEVEVLDDMAVLAKEYPLIMAVARASLPVTRHQPRVVRLSWQGAGPVMRTVCIAGKGVTYDTGGADIKVGGSMAGLRIDKCGAGAAAGFILACAQSPQAQTKGLRVIVELGCVRNSVGSDMYVPDEILVSHAGKRVLIGNTDAEGRLVLADCLSHLREKVLGDPAGCPRPTFFSFATLTGHAGRGYGAYAVANDNGAARASGGLAPRIAAAGAMLGQPMEISSLRREDYMFIAPGSLATPVSRFGDTYDVIQSNNAASVNTTRGHQYPMAFLDVASGLQAHSAKSQKPFPFCHIDLAGSCHDMRGVETGSPIVPLYGHFVLGLSVPELRASL